MTNTGQVPPGTSFHDFLQGVISGVYNVKPTVLRNIEQKKFDGVADWARQLLSEWDHCQNGSTTPQSISHRSNRAVWWKRECEPGKEPHRWSAIVANRAVGSGCPVCHGTIAQAGVNDLHSKHPELAAEWHHEKNGDLTPQAVTRGSKRKVWWQKNCGGVLHEWEASVGSRTTHGTGCSVCAGQSVQAGVNDLATVSPALAAEWHPTKNGKSAPQSFTAGSGKKVWWQKDCDGVAPHEWEAKITDRVKGGGCPVCSGHLVQAGVNDLATENPELAAQWHPTKNGDLTPESVTVSSGKRVWWTKKCLSGEPPHTWKAQVGSRSAGAGCGVCRGLTAQPGVNDLATRNAKLAAEWHTEKNGNLTPRDITPGSDKRVWWRCESGHEWESTIYNRSAGSGCPSCCSFGYDNTAPGWLYVVYNYSLDVWKIGISNHPEGRMSDLKQSGFSVDEGAFYGNTGDFIQTLEAELLGIVFERNGALSLKESGKEQLYSKGYTESWLSSSFTPEGVDEGDCQAMLAWLLEEQKRLDWGEEPLSQEAGRL